MKGRSQAKANSLSPAASRRRLCLLLLAISLLPVAAPLSLAQVGAPRPEPSREVPGRLAVETAKRGEELRRRWNLDAAEAAFREAATLDPANLEASLGLVRIARSRIDYARAINLLNKAVKHHPSSPDIQIEFGMTYLAAEEPARALNYFEKALKLDSTNEAAIVGQAATDLLARDFSRADLRLRSYLSLNPQSSSAHAMLARVLIEENKNVEAAAEADRAIAIDNYNADALYTLAFVRASERKPDEVRTLARRVLTLDPFNAGARRLLSQYLDGRAGYDQNVSDEARRHFDRGRALKREGKLLEAVSELESALRVEPRYYRALVALGDVWLRTGDYDRAATAARLAIDVDGNGSIAHLELSYAQREMQEQARIEIGGADFGLLFYDQPSPPAYALTQEVFPNYRMLTRRQQMVVDRAVAPLAFYLPALTRRKARHYLLAYDERISDVSDLSDSMQDKTFDGRYYASIRGVGGRITVSGIEYINMAAHGGFHTIAHEFAHQVHMTAMDKEEVRAIHRLYEQAKRDGRLLDYYAGANEYEYFAQGYEAFISERKRPSAGVTARHTRNELLMRDPELYKFISQLAGKSHSAHANAGNVNSLIRIQSDSRARVGLNSSSIKPYYLKPWQAASVSIY